MKWKSEHQISVKYKFPFYKIGFISLNQLYYTNLSSVCSNMQNTLRLNILFQKHMKCLQVCFKGDVNL